MRTLLTSLLLGVCSLHAAISPEHTRRLQEAAAEALVIQADQVDVKITPGKDGRQLDVQVAARVQSVLRSKAGHKPGDQVKIAYTIIQTVIPMPGPGQPKVLEKGETVRAYLNHTADRQTLGLAAYGHSFQQP